MRELAQRLKMQAVIAQAERLRAAGDEPAAEAICAGSRRTPASICCWPTGRWRAGVCGGAGGLSAGETARTEQPGCATGRDRSLCRARDLDAARQRLKTEPQPQDASLNSQRRVANARGGRRSAAGRSALQPAENGGGLGARRADQGADLPRRRPSGTGAAATGRAQQVTAGDGRRRHHADAAAGQ